MMNCLRKYQSMPLKTYSRDHHNTGTFPYTFTGQHARPQSLTFPLTKPESVHASYFSGSTDPCQADEQIPPFLLDSQEVSFGLRVHQDTDLETVSDEVGEKDVYALEQFHNSNIDIDEVSRYSEDSELFPSMKDSRYQETYNEQQRNDKSELTELSTRIYHSIESLVRDQQKVSGMRIQLTEMRSQLNKKRNAQVVEWVDALKQLKSIFGNTPIESTNMAFVTTQLNSLETLNQHSDEYLMRENEYRNFQRQLEADEDSLQRKEGRMSESLQQFANQADGLSTHNVQGKKASTIYENDPHPWNLTEDNSDYASTCGGQKETHPLLDEYLSRLGDVRIYRDRIAELSMEHAEISEREASLALVNIPLDQDSRDFLATYEKQRLELEQMLAEEIEAAASLRLRCKNEGLPLPPDTDEGLTTRLHADIRQGLPLNRDLLWLSDLDDDNTFVELAASESFDVYHFINMWIFHQLRHSTSFIHRFKSNPRLQRLGIDEDKLSEWVVKLWFDGEHANMMSPFHTPLASG